MTAAIAVGKSAEVMPPSRANGALENLKSEAHEAARANAEPLNCYQTFAASNPITMFAAIVFLLIPTCVIAVTFVFGCFLAWLENWSIDTGFYYVVGNVVGLATPLTEESPKDDFGKVGPAHAEPFSLTLFVCDQVIDIFVTVWSLSVTALVIGASLLTPLC